MQGSRILKFSWKKLGTLVDMGELESLCSCVDNVAEFGLQRGAADQETVDVFFLRQF